MAGSPQGMNEVLPVGLGPSGGVFEQSQMGHQPLVRGERVHPAWG